MAVDSARAKTLFLNASDLADPAERAAYLDHECGDNAELRDRVEALLRANDDSPGPPLGTDDATIDSDAGRPATKATGVHTPSPELDPSPISLTAEYRGHAEPNVLIAGRYTLQGKIGEGGMGEVWVARQTEPVKRKVALKLIKPGMDSRAVLQRFEQERQALALMDHPNIARVLDAGLTPNGQPFFVMELVNGLPLNKFCDELKLTPKERLELFVPICQAVQHAHQKGIVHRDLKPANILVTTIDGKPVPKVIDFGVVKATAGKLTDESMSTQFGAIVGTLEYMSPEQAGFSGEDIDTRADIYSLGVILYELLTGLRPIDAARLKKAAMTEMIRIIQEEEPSKPSTRLSTAESLPSTAALRQIEPRRLMALLRGDLDWVVMKCLEKRRERRYETANGLARDVQRYLSNEPVEARPPSAGYRIGKFLLRNKGQVVAAGLVMGALAVGLASVVVVQRVANERLSASLARETKANEDLATANGELTKSRAAVEARYELAMEAIQTFHTGVSEDFLMKEEQFKGLRDRLLKSASDFYDKLGALLDKEADPASRRALWRAKFDLAELTDRISGGEDALAMHRAVLAARVDLAAEPRADPGTTLELGESRLAVAHILLRAERNDEALSEFRRAESLLAGPASTDPKARGDLASCRAWMGYLLGTMDQLDAALAAHEAALADRRALAAERPDSLPYRGELASSLDVFGHFKEKIGRSDEALASFREGRNLLERVVAGKPETQNRALLSHLMGHVSGLLLKLGDPSGAEAECRRAIAIEQKMADDYPAVFHFRRNLAVSRSMLAGILSQTGRVAEAEAELRRVIVLYQKMSDDRPNDMGGRMSLSSGLWQLGELLWQAGRQAEGEALLRQALAIGRELIRDHPDLPRFRRENAGSRMVLGLKLSQAGRTEEGAEECRKATADSRQVAEENPENIDFQECLSYCLRNQAELSWEAGRRDEAEVLWRQGLAVQEKLAADHTDAPKFRVDVANARLALGTKLAQAGRVADGEAEHRLAIAISRRLVEESPVSTSQRSHLAYCLWGLGTLLWEASRSAEAEEAWRENLAIQMKLAGENPGVTRFRFDVAGARLGLAHEFSRNGRMDEAVAEVQKAVAILRPLVDAEPASAEFRRRLANGHLSHGSLLSRTGKLPQAEAEDREALALYRKLADDNPKDLESRNFVGSALNDLGDVARRSGRPAEARDHYQGAIVLRQALVQEAPQTPKYRGDLAASYRRLGLARRDLGDPVGAVDDARKALGLLEALTPPQAEPMFEEACCHAALSGLAAKGGAGLSAAEEKAEADRAMGLLRKAADLGHRETRDRLDDSALDPLRDREDFEALVAELEKTPPPGPDRKPQ